MFAVVVDFQVKEYHIESFATLIDDHARKSVETEPGCLRFEVCRAMDDPQHYLVYEVYKDAAAFEDHKRTERFGKFFQLAEPMFAAGPVIRTFERITGDG